MGMQGTGIDAPMFAGDTNSENMLLSVFVQAQPELTQWPVRGGLRCDTFLDSTPHSRSQQTSAGVGACKATSCRHNDDYECTAEKISVGHASASVCCLTYQAR